MTPGLQGERAPLLWLLLPLMAGLSAGRAFGPPAAPCALLAGLFAAAAIWTAWARRPAASWLWPPALALAAGFAGMAYYPLRLRRAEAWAGLPPREACLTLRVERTFQPPGIRPRANGFGVVTRGDFAARGLAGRRIYFSVALPPGTPPPLRSSEIAAAGLLAAVPADPAGGSFEAYILDSGAPLMLTRGRWLREAAPASRYRRFCSAAERRFHVILGAGLGDRPVPASILRAMMLGQKQEMRAEEQALFMHSGTLHLFAISGLNITAISISIQILLTLLRAPRTAAAAFGLAALWLYVDITGASPSAVRAFVMCAGYLAGHAMRRPGNVLSSLASSALAVLLWDPMQLFGASFQLSYGIVAVLVLLGAPLARRLCDRWPLFTSLPPADWGRLRRWIDRAWRGILGVAGIGAASALVSTVAGIEFFGLFTPAALAVNLVLIPMSTLIIGAGFLSLVCGLSGLLPGSILFNHAGALLVWLMDAGLRAAVAIPGAYRSARFEPAWLGPAAFAALLGVCLAGYSSGWRTRLGGWLPPFALVAIVLVFGVRYAR